MDNHGRGLADAVLCADLHIREDTPECRTDDYFAAQQEKLQFIIDLAKEGTYSRIILCAGDLFHWGAKQDLRRPSPFLLQWAIKMIRRLQGTFIVVPGQHDLPGHNMGLLSKSGLKVLEEAGVINILGSGNTMPFASRPGSGWKVKGFPWGEKLGPILCDPPKHPGPDRLVAVAHVLAWAPLTCPFPGAPLTSRIDSIFEQVPDADLIVTGDNHIPFSSEHRGRKIVNPGSMMRMTAAQASHKPHVYLWWARDLHIKECVLPHRPGVVSREHLEKQEERDERLDAFVKRLREEHEVGLDFESNMAEFLASSKHPKRTTELIWEAIHGKDV